MSGSIDHILEELEKAQQLIRTFGNNGKLPEIERDIVLSKLRFVYEHLLTYSDCNSNETPPAQPETDRISLTHITETEIKETIESVHATPAENTKQEVKELIIPEETKKPERIEKREETVAPKVSSVSGMVTRTETVSKKEILAEKFQAQSFLNEALTQYKDFQDLSRKIQNQPLKNIFTAINLNDKFLFIKGIFNNDASLYQSTIEKLNSSENFNEAVRYLDEKFSWDFNDVLVQKLLELVRRRYLHEG